MNSKQLRKIKPIKGEDKLIKRNPIYLVLDNVIDTYNIGSMFRLADAIAAEKLYICGDTEYPPNSRIHKAAVGTEEWIPWVKYNSAPDAIKELKSKNVQIIAVEQSPLSTPYSALGTKLQFPTAIIVGNETTGISKEVLDLADIIVELPMFGVNISLNVWGSAAIVAYKAIETLINKPYRRKKETT
ncbi:MAG: TrmH family RNA methyltransferase [Candidatus Woesebacteria bacterium]|nr:MAG: TrmH family RNA methyltransferase [Candidatus Woesebacteria bacterium]